jgi:hypothetical protein
MVFINFEGIDYLEDMKVIVPVMVSILMNEPEPCTFDHIVEEVFQKTFPRWNGMEVGKTYDISNKYLTFLENNKLVSSIEIVQDHIRDSRKNTIGSQWRYFMTIKQYWRYCCMKSHIYKGFEYD